MPISTSALSTFRLLGGGLALIIPASGLVLTPNSSAIADPMWLRWAFSGWFLLLCGLSFSSEWSDVLPRLWIVSVAATSVWYLSIAVMNEFALPYAVGVLVVLPVGGSVISLCTHRLLPLRWYYGLGILAVGGALLGSSMSSPFQGIYLACVITLVLAMYLTQESRQRYERRLRDSKERYKSVVNNANDAVLVHDLEGRIIEANPQAELLFGYSIDEMVGETIGNLQPFSSRIVMKQNLEKLSRGESVHQVVRYMHRDGSIWSGSVSMSTLEIEGREVACSMIRDVTEERALRASLREERDLLSGVLETSPIAITIVKEDGEIVYANSRAEEVMGLSREEIKDRTYNDARWQLTDPEGNELSDEELPFERIMKTGESLDSVEHAIERPGGERRLLSVNGAPFQWSNGSIETIVFAIEDITERRQVQEALEQSERRLQALFDHALDIILLTRDDGSIVRANSTAAQLLGYPTDELMGMKIWHLMPDHLRQSARTTWDALLTTGRAEDDYVLRTRSGDHIATEFRAVADIQPGLHMCILRDVSDRKRLEEQTDRFFSLTLDLLCIADTDGNFIRVNPAFEEVLGFTDDELMSRPFFEFVHPEDERATRQVLRALSEGRDVRHFVNRYRHKEGGYRWIEWQATPDPERSRIYAAARDITAQREYEENLRQAKKKAEKMNRLKSSFLANMSHEIRTPLTSIIGYADLLRDRMPTSERQFIERIDQSGRRLLTTLNSVLSLAQLESGDIKLSPEAFDGTKEIQRLVESLTIQAERKGIEIRTALPDYSLNVYTDRGVFSRTLTNVLHNAIKFTQEGFVRVSCSLSGEHLVVEVQDTGVGMEQEFMEDLYEAFQQESKGLDRRFEGNGLGLTITKHLVDLVGGSIDVESSKGEGTTFIVSMPRCWAESDQPRELPVVMPPDESLDRTGRKNVLIVDDEPFVSELLTEMLPEAYTFETAGSVRETTELMEHGKYDILFLDIHLKDQMNGVELRSRLEDERVLGETIVVAVTAYALPGDRENLLEAGFDGYIPKPFNREMLEDCLEDVLDLR